MRVCAGPATLIPHLVPQLRRLANVSAAQATEVLTEVLAGNADLVEDHAM